MNYPGFPTLTIRMQAMEYSIMQTLHDHQQEIEAEVERQLKGLITPESIEAMVRDAIKPVMKGILAKAMESAVHKAMWSQDVTKILETDVHAALMKVLREYWPGSEPNEGEVK